MAIKQSAIDVVAYAMARANHAGTDDVPERDVVVYHERAKLLLAGLAVIRDMQPSDVDDEVGPNPADGEQPPVSTAG